MGVSPSPAYCLRQDLAGQWYRIPFIYAYNWDAWCVRVREHAGTDPVPHYATPVELTKMLFEYPVDIG